jgi:hypothetical protein
MIRVPLEFSLVILSVSTNLSNIAHSETRVEYTIETYNAPSIADIPPLDVAVNGETIEPRRVQYPTPIASLRAGSDFSLLCTRLTKSGANLQAAWSGLLVHNSVLTDSSNPGIF